LFSWMLRGLSLSYRNFSAWPTALFRTQYHLYLASQVCRKKVIWGTVL